MTDTKLIKLREQEYAHLEKIGMDILNKIKEVSDAVSPCKIFCISYLAYLAAENRLKDTKSLIRFAEENIPEGQRVFIEKNIDDLWWLAVKLGSTYTGENMAAVLLWFPMSMNQSDSIDTPESIIKLANRLLEGTNESVADFCCGWGQFLLEALGREDDSSYFGIELDTECKEIATIRMGIASSDKAEINQGSVFALGGDKKFDKIFCDYPWGLKKSDIQINEEILDRLADMIPELRKTSSTDWLFIANVAYHLRDGGRAVVVIPSSMALNGGVNAEVREKFIMLGLLEAVISLPAKLYKSTSMTKSILVLSHNNKTVRMIDAASMASAGKKQNVISDEAAAEIVSLMERDAANSVNVSFDELEKCGYAINPSKYFNIGKEVKNGVEFNEVIRKMTRGTQIKASELYDLMVDTPTNVQYLMLTNIQDGIICGELPYLKGMEKKQEKYCVKDKSLLISKSGTPVKVAVASVQEGHKILANGNLYVIELDEKKVNPYFLKAYFESKDGNNALSNIMVGATIPNIPVDSLRKIKIPLPSMEEQNVIADKYLAKMDVIKTLKERLAEEMEELKSIYE